jgi:hypothetical protein
MRSAWAEWDPAVETAIFGSADADELSARISDLVTDRLGAVADAIFYTPGVGVVVGLRLEDGRKVVLKVHRWNVTVERLAAIQRVQAHLAASGLPAPLPLMEPESLASGIATAETFLPSGRRPRDPETVSRVLAAGLHRFVTAAPPATAVAAVGRPLILRPPDGPLWPEPHDVRFDFERTSPGAEWIDNLARLAQARLLEVQATSQPLAVGHFDWRVENVGLDETRLVAIYDWDSVAVAPEPVIVGNNAAQFLTDWKEDRDGPLPTVAEMRRFVDHYEDARGRPFSDPERELLDAANLAICCYGARCQHSDTTLHPEIGRDDNRWIRLLRERGTEALLG